VIGRLAAPVGLHDLDLGLVRDVQLARVGAAPERHDGRVLEQDDHVGNRTLRDGARE
jgi:hypothetical protein